MPSSAIRAWPPSLRKGASRLTFFSAASVSPNIGNSTYGGTGSSIARMWLSVGILSIAISGWQFDLPRPRWRAFYWARNDGLCMNHVTNAAIPTSVIS